ncbi:MAG: hypothetical protein M0R22_03595 [Dehalococcoidia bacterium]|jgi:hypothetical protein|nr:hypothetical protein [Dehalococcoidia bacterium]
MELSPLARERLARIGALTTAEQQTLQQEKEVEAALSAYYLGAVDAEGLWQQVKALTATHGAEAVKQAQARMLQTLRLQMADEDFEKRKSGLLALESLKKNGKHSAIELLLGSIVSLRRRYNEVKQQAYEQLRGQVEAQLNAAGEQARRKGAFVDTAGAVDATIKASPDWRDFMTRHDAAGQKTLDDYLARIKALL